ncbi:MAG: ABC transporter ATP-binding protein [Candidatus Pacebacteria bacterium]|nr:ABC transporter ATP-binding protein [Candidatus Paceibacterota bacterium]
MEPLIKTKDLKVIYNLGKSNEVRSLDGVSMEIYPREFVILFGPSGCGKSTLLYTILGLQRPTDGQVFIMGKDLKTFSEKDLTYYRLKQVGIIFQAYYLISSINVIKNIMLPKIFLEESISRRILKAKELLERFGIYPQKDKLPTALSGGQQQRVAIARSLINDPEIILADEPVGNLDTKSAEVVLQTLCDINEKDKKTIVLVTHDPRYLSFAHRVYHLKDGKIIRETINPEKSQIKEITSQDRLFTEIDRMARTFPYTPQEELKAKVLTEYLTHDLTDQQNRVLEEAIGKYLNEELDLQDLYNILDKPIEIGGVGLYKQTADLFIRKIEAIMEGVGVLREQVQPEVDVMRRMELATKFRGFLLDDFQGGLSYLQIQRLDEAIESRISGADTVEVFEKFLDKPFKEGGIGLNRTTARNFTRKLEVILSQHKKDETD